jgi:hypothetical protein
MLCCSIPVADFTVADIRSVASTSAVEEVAERPLQRNLFFPAFSPFSQKKANCAVLQKPLLAEDWTVAKQN